MIARDYGRGWRRMLIVAAALGGSSLVLAQQPQVGGRGAGGPAQAQAQQPAAEPKVRLPQGEQPRLVKTAVPVNPTDAIALVNGEPITRAQLADECIVRKGQEILDTLIARKLIEQELRRRKLEVTQAEIDREIEDVAMKLGGGLSREAWLRTLDKERGISPAQYARDIIYPTIALRKLAAGRVQVTDRDMKDAFEANFGAKLHCRIITCDKQQQAVQLWEELKKNPGAFPNLAKTHSTDQSTRALGGYLSEPISRHAVPRSVSDPAFEQLVDGDPKDKNPDRAPKDGDITGPIQVNEMAWILIKREAIDPPKNVDPNDKMVRDGLYKQLADVKTKEAMTKVFEELTEAAKIDNALTGTFKEAREQEHPAYREGMDANVKLMAGQPAEGKAPARPSGAPVGRTTVTPTGVPAEVAEGAKKLSQPIAPRSQ
jgi:parvulin-like peptidyl-prolyl isomerase